MWLCKIAVCILTKMCILILHKNNKLKCNSARKALWCVAFMSILTVHVRYKCIEFVIFIILSCQLFTV